MIDAKTTETRTADFKTAKGHIEVKNFALSYETIDGAVDAVTDTQIHVNPGEFVSIVEIGRASCRERV